MKTGDEMLKEAGWELANRISYNGIVKSETYQDEYINELEFDFTDKTFQVSDGEGEAIILTMKELQAINKKCQELGWI